MFKVIFFVLITGGFIACSKRIVINPENRNSIPYIEDVDLFLKNGTKLKVDFIEVDSGNLVYETNGYQLKLIPVTQVDSLVKKRKGKGALQGLGIGLATGISIGIISGYSSGDDPPCEKESFFDFCEPRLTAGEKAFLGSILYGGLGALLGLPLGAVAGSNEVYIIKN